MKVKVGDCFRSIVGVFKVQRIDTGIYIVGFTSDGSACSSWITKDNLPNISKIEYWVRITEDQFNCIKNLYGKTRDWN